LFSSAVVLSLAKMDGGHGRIGPLGSAPAHCEVFFSLLLILDEIIFSLKLQCS